MNVTKFMIAKKISESTSVKMMDSKKLLESFLYIIKSNSHTKDVKITKFGTFKLITTPKRIGRNPKTKESYIIPKLQKISFISSNNIKEVLN